MTFPTFPAPLAGGKPVHAGMWMWDDTSSKWVPAQASADGFNYVIIVDSVTGDPILYSGGTPVQGDIAHDGVDTAIPVGIGVKAIAHGTNPTAVAAADRTVWYGNRAGVPFVIGGHPNIITRSHIIAASDGAQTDAALLTISTGSKIVITQISAAMDAANSVNVAVKIGFGTATIPAASLAGTAAILIEGQFAGGGGIQKGNGTGIIGIGADNEDLRITSGSPTGGNIRVTYSYYTIES